MPTQGSNHYNRITTIEITDMGIRVSAVCNQQAGNIQVPFLAGHGQVCPVTVIRIVMAGGIDLGTVCKQQADNLECTNLGSKREGCGAVQIMIRLRRIHQGPMSEQQANSLRTAIEDRYHQGGNSVVPGGIDMSTVVQRKSENFCMSVLDRPVHNGAAVFPVSVNTGATVDQKAHNLHMPFVGSGHQDTLSAPVGGV